MAVLQSPTGVNAVPIILQRSVTAPLGPTPTHTVAAKPVYRKQSSMPAAQVVTGLPGPVAARRPTDELKPLWSAVVAGKPQEAAVKPQQVASVVAAPVAAPNVPTVPATAARTSWASLTEGDFASNRPRPQQLNAEPDATPATGAGSSSRTESEEDEDGIEEVENPPKRQLSRRFSWSEYPTTPLYLDVSAGKPKAPGTAPRIGIDIGGVLTREGDKTYMGSLDEWDTSWEADGALDAVRKITQVFGPSNTFLVSKVRPGGAMHRRMEQWLHETMDFCNVTGVPKDNIVFVRAVDGPQGKGVVCERLGISHFVDDKIEVLKSVFEDEAGNSRHLVERFQGLLFHFAKGGHTKVPPVVDTSHLSPIMRRHYRPAANWAQVLEQLRQKPPLGLHQLVHLLTPPTPRQRPQPAPRVDARPPGPWERTAQPAAASGQAPALQWSSTGRPKLVLKPRDPLLGPVAPEAAKSVGEFPNSQQPQAAQATPQTQMQQRPVPSPLSQQHVSISQTQLAQPAVSPSKPCTAKPQPMQQSQQQPQQQPMQQPQQLQQQQPQQLQQQPLQQPQPAARQAQPQTVVVSAVHAAVQSGAVSPSGRPKLQLKPRNPRLGAPGEDEAIPQGSSVPASPPLAAQPAPALPGPMPAGPTPSAPPGPALQPDPAGGRPRLVLKKRSEPPAAVPAPTTTVCVSPVRRASLVGAPSFPQPTVEASKPGPRATSPAPAPIVAHQAEIPQMPGPKPQSMKGGEFVQQAVAPSAAGPSAKAGPALQKDPGGGRPKLVLKPRTVPVPAGP